MGSRHFSSTATEISFDLWLVFTERGGARMTRDEPDLKPGERAMFVKVKLPRSVFRVPALRGVISVGADQARDAIVAEVSASAAKVLREHLGLELQLEVKP